mgnify:CR=1 FL=1
MLQFRAIALAVAGSLALAAPAFAGKLSIVIDDFGYRPQTENQVLALPATISVAVLPNAPHAREMATKAHNQGHEVLIHLPMAPLSKQPLEKDTLRPEMSSEEIERIIRDAFEYAKKNGRKKVTCVHKANILKMSDGMFLAIFREVAKDYPEIEADDKIIDNTCMQLVMNPNQFDVMVMQNLYGDILSDLCSGLIGGLGLVPSSNIGADYAMFEAVHGSAPDIAGKHLANPTAFLWSACMMLEYLGENETAARIRKAVDEVLAEGKHLTKDLHGTASTEEYVDAILERL